MPGSKLWNLVEVFRKLNEVVKYDNYPMPTIQDLLNALGHKNAYFCTLDYHQGYHNLPIAVEDRPMTVFSLIGGRRISQKYYRLPL